MHRLVHRYAELAHCPRLAVPLLKLGGRRRRLSVGVRLLAVCGTPGILELLGLGDGEDAAGAGDSRVHACGDGQKFWLVVPRSRATSRTWASGVIRRRCLDMTTSRGGARRSSARALVAVQTPDRTGVGMVSTAMAWVPLSCQRTGGRFTWAGQSTSWCRMAVVQP